MASTDKDNKKYLDEIGLSALISALYYKFKTNGVTDEEKAWITKQRLNLNITLSSSKTTIEFGTKNTYNLTAIITSNGSNINADKNTNVIIGNQSIPASSTDSNNHPGIGKYVLSCETTPISQGKFQYSAEATVNGFKITSSTISVNAYSKILYGGSANENVLKESNPNEIDTTKISLTPHSSLSNTSNNQVINISAPPTSTYYGYILIPVGTKDKGGTSSSLGPGGITVTPSLKSTTHPAATLPGNAPINFNPVSSETPEYVYMQPFTDGPVIKYRFVRTSELSSSLYPTITITLK